MVVTMGNDDTCHGNLFDPAVWSVTLIEKIIKPKVRKKNALRYACKREGVHFLLVIANTSPG